MADGTAYVVESGAISLPLGHPSRITCMEVHDTFAEAAAAAEACEFDSRVFPITIPDPSNEPGFIPALWPVPSSTAGVREILEGRNSQHVLKAEGASPDATDRENCANASPGGGPTGVGQSAAADPDGGHTLPAHIALGNVMESSGLSAIAETVRCSARTHGVSPSHNQTAPPPHVEGKDNPDIAELILAYGRSCIDWANSDLDDGDARQRDMHAAHAALLAAMSKGEPG